jgi:hypothetical protein
MVQGYKALVQLASFYGNGRLIQGNQKMFVASPASAQTRRSPFALLRFGIAVAAAATLLGAAPQPFASKSAPEVGQFARSAADPLVSRSAPAPTANVLALVSEDRARLLNDALPFSKTPIEAAAPLIVPVVETGTAGRSSIDCLTEAVYYEAASEPEQGQRAVAQVVLNRVRHPSFPNSVCAVVYQGSERRTGCQFTFTCDGSLRRPPARGLWSRARQVAESALNGRVESSVGMATHYHTDWVFPYWAANLKKITRVGTHIFYGWTGSWGRRAAFSQTALIDPPVTPEITAALVDAQPEPPTGEGIAPAAVRVRLVADATGAAATGGSGVSSRRSGALLVDERPSVLRVDQTPSRAELSADHRAPAIGFGASQDIKR